MRLGELKHSHVKQSIAWHVLMDTMDNGDPVLEPAILTDEELIGRRNQEV